MANRESFMTEALRPDYWSASLRRMARRAYGIWGKRAVDLLVAIPLAIMLLPLMVVLLLLVAVDGHGPLFVQDRIGRRGRRFACLKIRSMVPDADARLAELLRSDAEAAAEWAKDQKLENDPRITRIGRFLRKTSLDELPQLWNIIRGEMSLVGPRPVVPDELERYGPHARHYLAVTPGLTGPWQVSGRNDVTYDERVQMDVGYARRHSLFGDLRLVFLTGLAVMRQTGK